MGEELKNIHAKEKEEPAKIQLGFQATNHVFKRISPEIEPLVSRLTDHEHDLRLEFLKGIDSPKGGTALDDEKIERAAKKKTSDFFGLIHKYGAAKAKRGDSKYPRREYSSLDLGIMTNRDSSKIVDVEVRGDSNTEQFRNKFSEEYVRRNNKTLKQNRTTAGQGLGGDR
jgi:hypothetical protein